jgi:flagellar biosynthetic protein FliR
MSFDIGLSIAQVFNPVDETQADVIQNIIYFFALLIFLLIDGHHYLIRAISYSFSVVPIGNFKTTKSLFDLIIGYSSNMFVIAVKIASPILVTFFLINIGEGILARIIPQMQVFFVTQPLKIGIGLAVLIMTTPIYFYVIKNLLKLYEEKLFTLVQSIG